MQAKALSVEDRPHDASVLFGSIEGPRRAFFTTQVARSPIRWSLGFFAVMMALAVVLTLAQLGDEMPDASIDMLPSVTVMTLLIGVAAFPLRLVAVPLGVYVATFAVSFGLKLLLDPAFIPPGLTTAGTFWFGLVGNGVPGLAAGLAAQGVLILRGADHPQAQTLLSGMVALGFAIFALPVTAFVTEGWYDPAWLPPEAGLLTIWQIGAIGVVRCGLAAGVILLFLLDVPKRQHMRAALTTMPVFVLAGALANLGVTIYPPVDVMVLCLGVALFTASYGAILACILGLLSYVALTGAMVVVPPIMTPDGLRLEFLSLVLIVITYVLLLVRHQTHLDAERSAETLIRLQRVNRFANIGYFVFDIAAQRLKLDPVAEGNLRLGPSLGLRSLLGRIAPQDRQTLTRAMRDPVQGPGRVVTLHIQPVSADVGQTVTPSPPDKPRCVAIHFWTERLWDGRRMSYGAILDLTTEDAQAAALRRALAELSDQQNRQTQLFSIVSHELRTPASVISMLLEELETGASWAEVGTRLRAVSNQLLSVLADMRQTVRPEQNLRVQLEPIQPQEVATTVRNTFALMAAERQVEIDLDLSPEAWGLRLTDRVRLIQALSNLVKNAIIHGVCQRIRISYRETLQDAEAVCQWTVTDDGNGIREELLPHLFDAFRRGGGSSTARGDGSGLGLYVTRSAMESLGGRASHSPGADGGSVFSLTLPLHLAQSQPDPSTPGPHPLPPAHGRYRHCTVLIAEDSDLIGELMVARLQRSFGKVLWAKNGAEALTIAGREKLDLVLTDLFMPELGGDDLTATLRAAGSRLPIIGMTAAAIGDERNRFEAAGTDFVLTKPVSNSQLLDVLEKISRQLDQA